MAELFIIDDTWIHQQWVSTGGTRAKRFLQSPDGKYFYFKRSQLKAGKDYTYEFWSEIIASEIGNKLGFTMLSYHIAVYGEMIGCICQSMIAPDNEELIEIVKYLQAFAPTYNPTLKEHKIRYTFQLIENALERVKLKEEAMPRIIEVIVLDALIGNGDRHQENMAFISSQILISDAVKEMKQSGIKIPRYIKWLLDPFLEFIDKQKEHFKTLGKPMPKAAYIKGDINFSPIYDSGSSLGRELTEENLNNLLQNDAQFEAYISRGKSEIHWEGGLKLTHFQLLDKLLESDYKTLVVNIIQSLQLKWNEETMKNIVFGIDKNLSEKYDFHIIPLNRKQLIYKILTSRFKKLEKLLDARL